MNKLRYLAASAVVALCFFGFTAKTNAQVSIGVQVGQEPPCPYGYYDYAPYECAPYGYYGPEWFSNGAFIGAGPWYNRHEHFRGHVDRRYDPRSGYRGNLPRRGERPGWDRHHNTVEGFRGRDMTVEHPRDDREHDRGRGDDNREHDSR
jgi:hypothetical protein